jgi:hypothetical protein
VLDHRCRDVRKDGLGPREVLEPRQKIGDGAYWTFIEALNEMIGKTSASIVSAT